MEAEGVPAIVDFVSWFVVRGNATGGYQCNEDTAACTGALTMLCARNTTGDADYAWFDFQECMMSDPDAEPGNAEGCAAKHKIDWATVSTCVAGSLGQDLLGEAERIREKLTNPPYMYAPDIRIMGKQFTDPPATANYLKHICGLYNGTTKPAGCSASNIERAEESLIAASK